MLFKIDPIIFERYPSLNLGIVVARGLINTGEQPAVTALLQSEVQRIRRQYTLEQLKEQPKLQVWRDVYRSFGAKKYTCSVENLYRMILEGVELGHINTLVDIYNYISLKYMVPVGGDDIDKITGNITLTLAVGSEPFIRLNQAEVDHPKPGEVVYIDSTEVLCRRWNWRECDKSKMTEQTTNVALVIEGIEPITLAEMTQMTDELRSLVTQYCQGVITMQVLNLSKPVLEI